MISSFITPEKLEYLLRDLEDIPDRIRAIDIKIRGVERPQLERALDERRAEVTVEIAETVDAEGKRVYPNKEYRDAALTRTLADDITYVNAQNEVDELKREKGELWVELRAEKSRLEAAVARAHLMGSLVWLEATSKQTKPKIEDANA